MIRKYYIDDDLSGGGGAPGAPTAPKGYTVTTPQQRTDWNGFLDYASKQQGSNLTDPKSQAALLGQYKKANPNFSITANQIPNIQYEAYQLRKGDKFGNLGAKELGYIRQGLSPNYLNADTSNISKLYYPQLASHGTDIEGYYNSKFNPSAAPVSAQTTVAPEKSVAAPGSPPVAAIAAAPQNQSVPAEASPPTAPPAAVPAQATNSPSGDVPSIYANHDTALKRAIQLRSQPGNEFIRGRADTLIHANYVPGSDTKSFKESAVSAAKPLGIDPAMFYASAAEEGMTGLVPDKNGAITTGDPSHVDTEGKYPVDGFTNFGLDHFHDQFKELVKRGYLPKDFDYQKATIKNPENGEVVNSGNFRSVEDASKAKAAFIRMEKDNLDGWSKTNSVKLSPAANQFFTFMAYNGGPGTAHKLIKYYQSKGLLEGDKFLQVAPPHEVDRGDSYGKVLPRWKMAQLLKKEKIFDN